MWQQQVGLPYLDCTSKYMPISYCKALFELPLKKVNMCKVNVNMYVLWNRGKKGMELRGTKATFALPLLSVSVCVAACL